MLQKEIRSVEVKIVQNKLQKFSAQAFNQNSFIHGLWIAFYAAILGAAEPFIQNYVNNDPEPSVKQILATCLSAGLIASVSYLSKNGFKGSSMTNARISTESIQTPKQP